MLFRICVRLVTGVINRSINFCVVYQRYVFVFAFGFFSKRYFLNQSWYKAQEFRILRPNSSSCTEKNSKLIAERYGCWRIVFSFWFCLFTCLWDQQRTVSRAIELLMLISYFFYSCSFWYTQWWHHECT